MCSLGMGQGAGLTKTTFYFQGVHTTDRGNQILQIPLRKAQLLISYVP